MEILELTLRTSHFFIRIYFLSAKDLVEPSIGFIGFSDVLPFSTYVDVIVVVFSERSSSILFFFIHSNFTWLKWKVIYRTPRWLLFWSLLVCFFHTVKWPFINQPVNVSYLILLSISRLFFLGDIYFYFPHSASIFILNALGY